MQLVLFCFTLGASLVAALLILGVKKLSEKVRIFTSIILSSDSIFGIGMPRAMTGLVLLSWLGCFIGVLIGYPTQISKYAANNVVMPPAFAEANVAGNASIILHTLAGLIGVTALFGLLFFYMWAGPFLFGLERSFKQVYKHNWLLGPSVKAQMLWTVVVVVLLVSYHFFFSRVAMSGFADLCQGALGGMLSSGVMPRFLYPAAGRWGQSQIRTLKTESSQAEMKIEKIIHQTYKTTQLPDGWKGTPAAWKKEHPDWKYIFWTDESMREFVAKEYSWFLETYDAYEYGIQRADAIRYLAIYHYGGIYADMDLQPLESMEPYLKGSDVVVFETPNLGLTNMILAGRKGSRFYQCTIAQLMGRQTMWHHKLAPYKGWKILSSSGPAFWWSMLSNTVCGDAFSSTSNHEAERLRILQSDFMGRCSLCQGDIALCQKKGILRHLTGSSWHVGKKNTAISHFVFLCQPAVFVAIIGIVLKGLGLAHTWRRGSTMLRNTVADSEHGELLPSAHSAPQMRSEVTNEIIRIGILVVMVVSFMVKGGVG